YLRLEQGPHRDLLSSPTRRSSDLLEISNLHRNFQIEVILLQIVLYQVQCIFQGTSRFHVIVLDHDPVVQSKSVIGTTTDRHRCFLQKTKLRSRFPGVEYLYSKFLNGFCVFATHGGYSTHPLYSIE